MSGHSSMVEYKLPKLGVAGSNPVARLIIKKKQGGVNGRI